MKPIKTHLLRPQHFFYGLSALSVTACATARAVPPLSPVATVQLQPVVDGWAKAAPRWRDISNTLYSPAFRSTFSYDNAQAQLSYRRVPSAPYFQCHISARGLKPNFAYQLKLAGKPIGGPQGWGTARSYVDVSSRLKGASALPFDVGGTAVGGDDWSNQQLGYLGRWWDDTRAPSTNLDDVYFAANYPVHTVYGYIFMGDFVTDALGRAEATVLGNRSLHITWQDTQYGYKEAPYGRFNVARTPYGYDKRAPNARVGLWYELQTGRTQPVRLPSGTYHCRLLVTEEAFHGEGGAGGGVWQTVLATEATGDQNPVNDIVFTIR